MFAGLKLDHLTSTQKLILISLRLFPNGLFRADLRSMLKIRPEAISRAVVYLVQKNLVIKELRGMECFYRLKEASA